MQNKKTATAKEKRETLERLISQNVLTLANSTGGMYFEFAVGCIDIERQNMPEIFNEYEKTDDGSDEESVVEVLQYFIITEYLFDKLKENGLCVMESDDLYFYCRTQCGISLEDSGEFDFLVNN